MKFSIGDKIILKQTDEEGVVTSYINAEMVEVEVGGTVFPVYINDIDHPYLKWFTEKKKSIPKSVPEQLPVEKDKFKKPKLSKGVYLAFIPVYKADVIEDEVESLKIYLLNELQNAIHFQYKVTDNKQQLNFQHEGKLQGFGHLFLHTVPFETMNEQPRFGWEIGNAENLNDEIQTDVLRIKPQKLFSHIKQLLEKNEPSFSYLLIDEFKPKIKEVTKASPIDKKIDAMSEFVSEKNWKSSLPLLEIDLHLENLTENTRGLSSSDKLDIQLEALRSHLQTVINNRQERTIVIHGLGKGVLRDEVHKILRITTEVVKFSNDWHGRYGFGATEVWFKY